MGGGLCCQHQEQDSRPLVVATQPVASRHSSTPESKAFLPMLKVPPGHDCVLYVPLKPLAAGPLDVVDPAGQPVVRAFVLGAGSRADTEPEPSPSKFVLSSMQGEELAQCYREGSPEDPEIHFKDAEGLQYSMKYHVEAKRFTLEGVEGASQGQGRPSLHLFGAFSEHRIWITADGGDSAWLIPGAKGGRGVVASTMPPSRSSPQLANRAYYELSVSAGTELGLVLCALLCIDHLWPTTAPPETVGQRGQ